MDISGSHLFVDYSADEQLTLVKTLKIEEVVMKNNSIFIEHGYLQHAGARWKADAALKYRTYVMYHGASLKHSVTFAYGGSLRLMSN